MKPTYKDWFINSSKEAKHIKLVISKDPIRNSNKEPNAKSQDSSRMPEQYMQYGEANILESKPGQGHTKLLIRQ